MTRERWHLAYFADVFWRIWRLGRGNLIPTVVLKQKSTIDARCWSRSKMMNFEQSWNDVFPLSNCNIWCFWDATRRRKWAKTLEFIAFGRPRWNQLRGPFLVPQMLLQNALHAVAAFALFCRRFLKVLALRAAQTQSFLLFYNGFNAVSWKSIFDILGPRRWWHVSVRISLILLSFFEDFDVWDAGIWSPLGF